MKKQILLIVAFLLMFLTGFSQKVQKKNSKKINKTSNSIALKQKTSKKTLDLRKLYADFLQNSPVNKTLNLSKSERKCLGLPPNKYNESEWLLSMDPATGMPNIHGLKEVRDQLINNQNQIFLSGRTPGDAVDNQWVDRGPNNVGGRTRAIMFDPNDPTNETVFAGSVSGGLWKNTAISNSNSTWTRVNIAQNLNVSCIVYDPNNTQNFYLGTGESYTGDMPGDGVWKSTDGGLSWIKVFGGVTGPTVLQLTNNLVINSPASIAGTYGSIPTTAFGAVLSANITQNIVLVDDGSGSEATLGVNPLVNSAAINGKIALIRRGSPAAAPGTGTFVLKVTNAQNAGAIGVIVMNNVTGGPVAMGGTDPGTITIPSIGISKEDGDILQAAVIAGTVNGTLRPSGPGEFYGKLVPGPQYINEIKIRNNAGISEIYVAVGDSGEAGASLGGNSFGLYKSTNTGTTWNQIALPTLPSGNKYCPMDIEIASNNRIYVSTTGSSVFGNEGGAFLTSLDGNTFNIANKVIGAQRTQIAVSKTNPNKVYVLLRSDIGEADLYLTTDGFVTLNKLTNEPIASGTIPATDFTNGQSFYDLMLEVDPANDAIVYVGGINIYRSSDSGSNWTEISDWRGATGTSLVHSDQHGMAFKPGDSNTAIFGNDGGVFYSSNLTGAATSNTAITQRVKGFNVTQFYSVGVAPTGATGGNLVNDYFAAGAQDNGTNYFASVAPGSVNPSFETQGGDGAYTMFDQGIDKYYISNYVYSANINLRFTSGAVRNLNTEPVLSTGNNGAFICPMGLDSSKDILYSDYTNGTTNQIRRYSSIKTGTVVKTILTNALLTGAPTVLTVSKIATTTTSTLFVGTRNGKLLRITNAHAATPTWADITGPEFVGSVSDVELGATNAEIYVTLKNYGVINVWYSSDSGFTWENKEGNFPDIPVNCILPNPLRPEEVIVGSDLGVWYTKTFNTASPVWIQSYNGMSNVKVTDLDLRNDNAVYASTYGRGVFSGMFTSAVLSRDEIANTKGVSVYPNPSNGRFTFKTNQYVGKVNLQIVDLNGRVVFTEVDSNFNNEKLLNLDNLQTGIYILKADGDNLVYTQKIIIE
jgi:hypothetical protein